MSCGETEEGEHKKPEACAQLKKKRKKKNNFANIQHSYLWGCCDWGCCRSVLLVLLEDTCFFRCLEEAGDTVEITILISNRSILISVAIFGRAVETAHYSVGEILE